MGTQVALLSRSYNMNRNRSFAPTRGRISIIVTAAMALTFTYCNFAPPAFVVNGPADIGNDRPTLNITQPIQDLTLQQGSPFLIRWTDSDRDSAAKISFSLVNVNTNNETLLVENIEENDSVGPDQFTASTSLIAQATYYLKGTIDDSVNAPVEVFAQTAEVTPQRVEVTVTPPGQAPPAAPPIIFVGEPAFNQSVAQDDVLIVSVQPTQFDPIPPDENNPNPNNPVFDLDSAATLYIVLDTDDDPTNDDPANPETDVNGNLTRADLIVLRTQTIEQGSFEPIEFEIAIDLDDIPPRPAGDPYFVRATIDDLTNPRVHKYATGRISVVELAAGVVDLFDIGRTKSGMRLYGFNPGANNGSSISNISDFDNDGIDDFVVVAQFGNPRNFGPVGEAYLIYGLNQVRFGGAIGVNSVSESVSGVLFEGPPIRGLRNPLPLGLQPRTDGITSVSWMRDVSGDGRPELIFGLPHVHGAIETNDFDPGDEDLGGSGGTVTETEIEIVVRQGEVTIAEGDGDPETVSFSYNGVDDLTISSATPGTSNGSGNIGWQDDGPEQRVWTLIKFADLLDEIPDSLSNIQIDSIDAELALTVFDVGGNGSLHFALTDFNELTTFNAFAENGGEPEAGVDYVEEEIGNVAGEDVGTVTIDVSDQIQNLINQLLVEGGNEVRFIIVPEDDADNLTQARGSEFTLDPDSRPTLTITYTRTGSVQGFGCYPDFIVNNETNPLNVFQGDTWGYAGGFATVINSENRDNDPSITGATRLESTSIALELVGQEANAVLGAEGPNIITGSIFARAHDPEESGRIAGVRIEAGPFDDVDAALQGLPPREGLFGQSVSSIGDLNQDGVDELIISSPMNELYLAQTLEAFGPTNTHTRSTLFQGSITVIPGFDFNTFRDKAGEPTSASSIPALDHFRFPQEVGNCTQGEDRELWIPTDDFSVFAEDPTDFLGRAQSAGDFNLDGLDDILCAAPRNDGPAGEDSGAAYILYGRNVLGDFRLEFADDPVLRTPMLRIRGELPGDEIGFSLATGRDVNGDAIDDVFISSPTADFGGVIRSGCGVDFNGDGSVTNADFNQADFDSCRANFGNEVFSNDACKAFDFNNDTLINDDDEEVFDCLAAGETGCCANRVDNGFIAILFGGVFLDGDRSISQIATNELPGTIFYGSQALHRAGVDVSSAGDFNQDGFGDLLIAVPGETRIDSAGRERLGVVYLVFGGKHLTNKTYELSQVGSSDLPGIVFFSPYTKGRPNEAAPTVVAHIGDINNDGFGDISIGNPRADFIDLTFPQGPNAPGNDPAAGRRSNAGDAYIIYGSNFGTNRLDP